jgi:hypothetical protein
VGNLSLADQLRERFHYWEMRGRGWKVHPWPVELEPPFRPFLEHQAVIPRVVDTSRRPSALSSLFGHSEPSPLYVLPPPQDEEIEPSVSDCWPRAEYRILLPESFDLKPDAHSALLLALADSTLPISFELIGTGESVSVIVSSSEDEEEQLRDRLEAFAPDAAALPEPGFLARAWDVDAPSLVVEFGLSEEFMLPLRPFRAFGLKPLTGVVGALVGVGEGQLAVFQVLFQRARNPWAESLLRAAADHEGKPHPYLRDGLLDAAKEKVRHPLLVAAVRVGGQGENADDCLLLARRVAAALRAFSVPRGNELIPLSNDGYDDADHVDSLLFRASHRCGMLLTSEELASLVHLPGSSLRHPKLLRHSKRTKAAPSAVLGHPLILGLNEHMGESTRVSLTAEQRMRHVWIAGGTGTGKSSLLLSMICQDIEEGRGVGVLDPHGDLVDAVLARVPEERTRDVVLFDPADAEYPVGFNVLEARSETEKILLASDLVATFRRLSTSWGDQMNVVLANAILAFVESSTGGTLADLRRFLVEKPFREEFLRTVADEEVGYYWREEFPLLRSNAHAPILTRLNAFLRPKLIRNMVSKTEGRFSISEVMDSGGIFLGRLSQGAIGAENSTLLGAFLTAKFNQAGVARQEKAASSRRDFFLYADEFHNFVTPSLSELLSGIRKYRVGLTLAHQDLQQIISRDRDVFSTLRGSAGTRIVFRVSDSDARALSDGFSYFEPRDLVNLGTGEAVARVERSSFDFNLQNDQLPPLDEEEGAARRQRIRILSRERYAVSLAVLAPEQDAPEIPPVEPVQSAEPEHPSSPSSPQPRKAQTAAPRPTPGRGGAQHKYLQSLLKRLGEARGYRATVELEVPGGSVDVAFEKGSVRVACKISVTTPLAHELGNVRKCLAAGFGYVLMIVSDRRGAGRAANAVQEQLARDDAARVRCLVAEEVAAFLNGLEADSAGSEGTVKGYRVKTRFKAVEPEEREAGKSRVSEIIARSMKRMGEFLNGRRIVPASALHCRSPPPGPHVCRYRPRSPSHRSHGEISNVYTSTARSAHGDGPVWMCNPVRGKTLPDVQRSQSLASEQLRDL